MAYTRTQARNLLTATELSLFDAGRATDVKALTATQLKSKVERTRKLRDKYRDLFKRQRLAARDRTGSKGGRSGVANARSKEKAVLFGELLERFQARLKLVNAAAKKSAARTTAGKKATAKKAAGKKAAPRKAAAKKMAAKKSATKKSATKKTPARTSSTKKAAGSTGKKTATRKAAAKKPAAKKASARPSGGKAGKARPAGTTATGKATQVADSVSKPAAANDSQPPVRKPGRSRRSLADVAGADVSPIQGGYVSGKAKITALERRLAESRVRPIQAHISSSGRRNQARRDKRRG